MFRTEINIPPSASKMDLAQPVLTIGSCFSDVIGDRLADNKFPTLINPFGTVYNPVSIFKLTERALTKTAFVEETTVESQGIFHHYDLHSSFGATTVNELLAKANKALDNVSDFLPKANWLVITLGTAVVYSLKASDQIVANCHKVPASNFSKRMLSVKDVIRSYENIRDLLLEKIPGIQVIVTVSPVRHIKDTLVVNSQSKSILRVAAAELASSFAEVSYFPSYEMMMDDLRDYRFYEKDMIHPNETAHDYIWEHFSASYFNDTTLNAIAQWQKLKRNLEHKPFHPESAGHQAFLKKTLADMELLARQMDLTKEIADLKNQIL